MSRIFIILPVIAGACWGAVGVFVRYLTADGFSSTTILAMRFSIAAALFIVVLMFYDRRLLRLKQAKDALWFIAAGAVGVLCLNLFYNEAINSLNLSLAVVLLATAPIFVLVLSALFLSEKVTVRKVVCILVAIFGCVLVSGALEGGLTGASSLRGLAFGLGAPIFWALFNIASKKLIDKGYNSLTITCYSMLAATVALIPFADWGMVATYCATGPATNTLLVVSHAVVAAFLPYLIYTFGLAHVDASKASVLCAVSEPSSAALYGAVLFAEAMSPLMIVGMVVAVIALAVLTTKASDDG